MAETAITIPFDARTAEEMQELVYDYWTTKFPDWVPNASNPEVIQTEAITALLFELFNLAAAVPPEIFAYLGRLIKIEPEGAVAATVATTWTALTDFHGQAKVIPVDTLVGWSIDADTLVGFRTINEVTIPVNSDTTAPGEVLLRAEVEGSSGNGFSGEAEIVTLLDFVDTVVAVGTTTGGKNAEDFTAYLARLSTRLKLLADRPIREADVAIWATTVMDTIVGRAIAFDNYNADLALANQERHSSLSAHGPFGADLTTPEVDLLMAALALTREINFNFHFVQPTRTQIDVKAVVVAEPGQDLTALVANVKQALAQVLDPLVWGRPISGQGNEWRNETTVRIGWVYAQIVRVEGVRYIDESSVQLQIRANGGAWQTTDYALAGLAPLVESDITDMDITAVAS
jgi:hypothetical protein